LHLSGFGAECFHMQILNECFGGPFSTVGVSLMETS